MPETTEGRVAVYIDFDNIVISRYAQVHGKNGGGERLNRITAGALHADKELAQKLKDATVDIGAILDFATSFGSVVVSRAYADWSLPVNSNYSKQLIDRAVDLVQLFPTSGQKNGADIRLAVDALEDLFRLPDLTHVVIVAGDSDYIALAQRTKRLGRYVVGIGVAGSSSASLANACDEFEQYENLPGIDDEVDVRVAKAVSAPIQAPAAQTPPTASAPPKKPTKAPAPSDKPETEKPESAMSQKAASALLVRALRLGHAKDEEWLHSPTVKNQMLRINPSFSDKALGYGSFANFIKSRGNIVELDDKTKVHLLRLRPEFQTKE